MRVVAGRLGGRRLAAPAGAATRPTSDRVREALFSTLGPLNGERVLDLYAGSGALAIEALSRGAARALLVERDRVMRAFRDGAIDVLVATTVIEVGIDVPNATVILVEDAERYGISQLHQLRGRVGRGPHESLCLLFGPKESLRLRALAEHRDGFRLAEIDLELRGEGELTGTRQSGLARFRFARLPDDVDVLERGHARAAALLDADPRLETPEHVLLAAEVAQAQARAVAAG